MALLFERETYNIIGACMKVHKILGPGFLESIYQEALEKEFTKEHIPYLRQKRLSVVFDGEVMDKYFVADFFCYGSVILEIKATGFIHQEHLKQVVNYLKATNTAVGLLINFGQASLNWKRLINTRQKSV